MSSSTAVDAAFKKIAQEVRLPGFRPGQGAPQGARGPPRPAGRPGAGAPGLAARVLLDGRHRARRRRDRRRRRSTSPAARRRATSPSTPSSRCARRSRCPATAASSVTLERPGVDDEALDAQIDRMRDLDSTLERGRPAGAGGRHRHDRHRRHARRRAAVRAHRRRLQLHGRLRRHHPGGRRAARRRQGRRHPRRSPPPTPTPTRSASCSSSSPSRTSRRRSSPSSPTSGPPEASEFDTVAELRASLADRMTRRPQGAGADGAAGEGRRGARRAGHRRGARADGRPGDAGAPAGPRHAPPGAGHAARAVPRHDRRRPGDRSARSSATPPTQAVKVDLALRAVADAEGIECTDDDLDDELEGVADRVGEDVDEVRERFERAGQMSAVRSDIRKRKALEWLLERVEVLDPEGATDRSQRARAPQRRGRRRRRRDRRGR